MARVAAQRESAPLVRTGDVQQISVEEIWPNPTQPRRHFDGETLRELAASIRQFGILCPLCIRRENVGYELIAGERRLRAARLAGLREVPCTVLDADDRTAETLALVENLQREDLDYLEEAEGIQRLCQHEGLSQEEVARLLSRSPAAVSNKLRLLRHPPELRMLLRQYRLSERHARALLRIEDPELCLQTLHHLGKNNLSAQQAEQYVDGLLTPKKPVKKRVLGDPSLFFTTLDRAMQTMRKAGIPADMETREEPEEIRVTIRIPK